MSAHEGGGEDKCTSQVYSHCPLSVPSRVPAALHSVLHKREPVLDFHASAPWLIKFQDPRQHTMVQLEDLVHVVMPATFPQNQHHSMSIWQKRTCKPHPSYVGTKKIKTKNKNKKTAPTDIHVVCKQPKLQYGIERVLSFNS